MAVVREDKKTGGNKSSERQQLSTIDVNMKKYPFCLMKMYSTGCCCQGFTHVKLLCVISVEEA